jgi:signal transduction histidine kinase
MNRFALDSFYNFFQGALILQALLFFCIYLLYKKKEFLYYSLYLFLLAAYYLINASEILMDIPIGDPVIHLLLKYLNMPLVMLFNIFYLLFITSFLGLGEYRHIYAVIRTIISIIVLSLIVYILLRYLNQPVVIVLNIINLIGLIGGLLLFFLIIRQKLPYGSYVAAGMLLYIIGSIASVIAVISNRNNPDGTLVEYPLFFVKLGVLADTFLYFIALIGKWIDTEKSVALLALERELAVEKERNRIKKDLHDELGASLSGISMYSHLAKEQLRSNHSAEIERSLNIMQHSSAQMIDKLNDIVWLVNPEQDSLQNLVIRLEEYATDMAAVKNMQVKIILPEKMADIILPVESRRNIYLFCKEAINNAVKYSNATLLELTVKEVDGKLEFSVSDNGKGFDAEMVRRGNGLENMQKRADEIGARLVLQSKENKGTAVYLQCKIT